MKLSGFLLRMGMVVSTVSAVLSFARMFKRKKPKKPTVKNTRTKQVRATKKPVAGSRQKKAPVAG